MVRQEKGVNWVFTGWDLEEPVFTDKMRYLCYEAEITPSTGKHHWQGYVGFKNQITMQGVIERLNFKKHPFVEKMRGNLKQNEDYCSKEANYTKHGDIPICQGTRSDLVTVAELVRSGATDKDIICKVEVGEDGETVDYGEKWRMNYKGIQAMRSVLISPRSRLQGPMDVRIRWGAPGIGKTWGVYEEFAEDDVYVKMPGKWWDGYTDQKCVIIDDFDPENCFDITYDFYLKLLDMYKMSVEVKGATVAIAARTRTIVFTSNFDPKTWFCERKNRKAFFRRVTSIVEVRDRDGDMKLGGGNIDPPLSSRIPEVDSLLEFMKMKKIIADAPVQEYEEF